MSLLLIWSFLLLTGFIAPAFPKLVEENNRFCISTEPLLMTDMENHVNPSANDPHCALVATTLTSQEKENFLNIMCRNHSKRIKEDFYFFILRNGELESKRSYHDICTGKINPLLAWIPFQKFRENFAPELDPMERTKYIAKATNMEHKNSELCHFPHTDILNYVSPNLFTCLVIDVENNLYGLDANINILVQILPIMYEIRNVSYASSNNVTQSYKTMIGKTFLKNLNHHKKRIYGSVDYAYVEKLKLNESSVYGDNLEKLPVLFEHKGSVLDLDADGVAKMTVKNKTVFGRSMEPNTDIKVYVIGQWAEHRKEFSADIYEYFGYGIKRFKHEIHGGIARFTLIESTEPVYESQELSHSLHEHKKEKIFERLTSEVSNNHGDSSEWEEELSDLDADEYSNPDYYSWFIIGALSIGLILLLVIYGMVRSCSKREVKQKYKFTGI